MRSGALSLTVNEHVRLTITIAQENTKKRLVGGRCVKTTPRNRRKPACLTTLKTLTVNGAAGATTIKLPKRVKGRALPRRYVVVIVATDDAGNTSLTTRINGKG